MMLPLAVFEPSSFEAFDDDLDADEAVALDALGQRVRLPVSGPVPTLPSGCFRNVDQPCGFTRSIFVMVPFFHFLGAVKFGGKR